MKKRQSRKQKATKQAGACIKAESWIEALFLVVLQLRDENANGVPLADNWLAGVLQIMGRAEARGYELTATESVSALLSDELTDEEAGIYLAALQARGWIEERDFDDAFLQGEE